MLLVGLAIGFANGIGVAVLDVPPLVMTLGMNSILQGVALIYTTARRSAARPALCRPCLRVWPGSLT